MLRGRPDVRIAYETREACDVVVVGGGIAGLAASRELSRSRATNVVVVELESKLGGTSVGGEEGAMRFPWGAHYLPAPLAENHDLTALLTEMGVVRGQGDDGELVFDEGALVREPDERLFYRGYWYGGLYPLVGETAREKADRERFDAQMTTFSRLRDGRGRRAFSLPIDEGSDDAELTALDRVSASDWLAREGYTSSKLRWLCDYACRDDFGLRLEETSAWALIHYHAARLDSAGETRPILTWPNGNQALVTQLERSVDASQRRAGLVVTRVAEHEGEVLVDAVDAESGAPRGFRAPRAIVATPTFLARRIVPSLASRSTPSEPVHGPWVVANVHLRDRPLSRGAPDAWDNVIYDSPSLGYVSSTHQRGRDHGETVWTYYLPLTGEPRAAREKLLAHPLEHWQDAVLSDLSRCHSNFRTSVRKVDVWRWGHAMVQPRVGSLFDGTRTALKAPLGRIHFAHSDLSGIALFEEAFFQGTRAAREVRMALTEQGT